MKYKWYVVGGLVVWAAFVWLGIARLDPDYGWHIRMGEYISLHGIPKTDPLSYTMANFPFIDHEWLTNLGMYWGDRTIGKAGMAVVAATVVVTAVAVAVPKKWWKWSAFPALLVFSIWWPRAGVRPQIEDWILLPLVIRLVGEEKLWKKWKWFMPLVMCFWANIHGGYIVGLAIVGTIVVVKMIEDKKPKAEDLLVLGACGLMTLINPYGLRLWGEVWQQLSDRKVGKIIAEWQPFYAEAELGYAFLVAWVGTLIWKFKNKIERWKLVVVLGTFTASLSSLRHGALFAVVALPVAAELSQKLYDEFVNDELAIGRLRKFYGWLMIMAGVVLAIVVGLTVFNPINRLSEDFFYPKKAIFWLKENGVSGNLYTDYGWGGYFDWKLPKTKIFIDGRMATWKWKSPDPKYSDYVFDEYMDVAFRGKWENWVDKYGIKTVVLSENRSWPVREWLKRNLRLVGIGLSEKQQAVGLTGGLEKAGWEKVYGDEVAAIYKKP